MVIGLGFGQWYLSGSDMCKFLVMPLKGELCPSFFSSLLSGWNVNIMLGTIAAMLGHVIDLMYLLKAHTLKP